MKKIVCILFSLTVWVASIFADKSRFYENGKVIDTMYVNSEDGLKVRDYPSLKSNRLCGLQHRLPVKVVALGREETIDGITAPWVEILIPRYEWKGEEAEYGWVFGGYLAKEQPKFIAPKTKEQLEKYFQSHALFICELRNRGNAKYRFLHDGSVVTTAVNDFIVDTYEVVAKNKLSVAFFADGKKEYTLFDIKENSFRLSLEGNTLTFSARVSIRCKNDEDIPFFTPAIYFGENNELYCYEKDPYNHLATTIRMGLEKTVEQENFVEELIKSGVSAKGTKYEQQYHDYWNPMMEQHQKKADAMK